MAYIQQRSALHTLVQLTASNHVQEDSSRYWNQAACLASSGYYIIPPELKFETNLRPEPSRDMCGSMSLAKASSSFLFRGNYASMQLFRSSFKPLDKGVMLLAPGYSRFSPISVIISSTAARAGDQWWLEYGVHCYKDSVWPVEWSVTTMCTVPNYK